MSRRIGHTTVSQFPKVGSSSLLSIVWTFVMCMLGREDLRPHGFSFTCREHISHDLCQVISSGWAWDDDQIFCVLRGGIHNGQATRDNTLTLFKIESFISTREPTNSSYFHLKAATCNNTAQMFVFVSQDRDFKAQLYD